MPMNKEQRDKILQLVQDAVNQDKALREKYSIGDKFRFIRDRLSALLKSVEESIAQFEQETVKKIAELAEDEVLVYVYLFNAQGQVVASWRKMVSPGVMYEYSVNRPIYMDRAHVEAIIRSKQNKAQHGYITIAIKKQDILPPVPGSEPAKDFIGNPVYKVKEGALRFEKLRSFTHQEHDYVINPEGELVRKE